MMKVLPDGMSCTLPCRMEAPACWSCTKMLWMREKFSCDTWLQSKDSKFLYPFINLRIRSAGLQQNTSKTTISISNHHLVSSAFRSEGMNWLMNSSWWSAPAPRDADWRVWTCWPCFWTDVTLALRIVLKASRARSLWNILMFETKKLSGCEASRFSFLTCCR